MFFSPSFLWLPSSYCSHILLWNFSSFHICCVFTAFSFNTHTQSVVTSLLWAGSWNLIAVITTPRCPVPLRLTGLNTSTELSAKHKLQDQNLNHLVFFSEKGNLSPASLGFTESHPEHLYCEIYLSKVSPQNIQMCLALCRADKDFFCVCGYNCENKNKPDDKSSDHTDLSTKGNAPNS